MGLRSVLPQSGLPTRQVRKKIKVDTSKFMTPYLAHSQKMLDQFSHVCNVSSVLLAVYFLLVNLCINSNLLLFFLTEQVPSCVWRVQRETSCLHCRYSWNDTDQEGPGAAQWGITEDIRSPFSIFSQYYYNKHWSHLVTGEENMVLLNSTLF